MTEEKQGVSAWLRGIIDEREVDRMRSCTAIAEAFGIDCKHEKTCRDCITRMMTTIADRIDLEMMENERLKKENAELKAELADWKGNAEGFQPDAYMKLPVDADGAAIHVGDIVYRDDDPEQLIVESFDDLGCVYITLAKSPNGILYTIEPSRLSHERPDSWERIEEDAKLVPRDYLEKRGMNPEKTERIASMMADLVRRAKALAKATAKEGE